MGVAISCSSAPGDVQSSSIIIVTTARVVHDVTTYALQKEFGHHPTVVSVQFNLMLK